MTIRIKRMTIIGVGLLGASLGLALKKRGMVQQVTGVGRRKESLDVALERGAIDNATLDVETGVAQADAVAIATPAGLVAPMLDATLAAAPNDVVLFDVASTKQAICSHAQQACPQPRRFVGCHPMAGGEKFGPAHGNADFYVDSVCLVEQDTAIDATVRDFVCALWRSVGARVVDVDATAHDAILARTSHVPHVVAAALTRLAADHGVTAPFIGKGFRDTTRIAASRPEIWRDICRENHTAVIAALAAFRNDIEAFEALLKADDAAGIEAFFEAGATARHKVTES